MGEPYKGILTEPPMDFDFKWAKLKTQFHALLK